MTTSTPNQVLQTETGVSIDRLVVITGLGNRIELQLQLIEMNIFEDVFSHNMSATLILEDGLNLIEKLHLCGQEWVFLRVSKPGFVRNSDGADVSFAILMRLYKIEKIGQKNAFVNRYMMHLCKEQQIYSLQSRMSKAYKQVLPEIVIKEAFKNHFFYTDEEQFRGDFEVYPMASSASTLDFTIPNLRPFDAITYAVSIAKGSNGINDFLFFESNQGYRFVSLTDLLSQDPILGIQYRIKNVDTSVSTGNDPYVNSLSPVSMGVDVLFDYIQSLERGEFGVQSDSFDVQNQVFYSNPISYNTFLQKYKGSNRLNEYPKVPNNDWGELSADGVRVPYHRIFKPFVQGVSSSAEFMSADAMATRHMQLASIYNQKIRLQMPGSPILRAGAVIKLNYPSMQSKSTKDTTDDLLDRYLAANYLILSIRHVITPRDWYSYCEISKDCLPHPLPDNKSSNFTLQGL